MIVVYDTDVAELRDEVKRLKDKMITGRNGHISEDCVRLGHEWERIPYCFPDDTNPMVCRRCGAEKND